MTSFWLSSFILQGHTRLYKKVTFYSSFNNDRFFNGWSELIKDFKQGKNFTIIVPQTIYLGTLANHVSISLS